MKKAFQVALVLSTVQAVFILSLIAQQAAVPAATKAQSTVPQQTEAQKRYSEIMKERNLEKRASELQEFIRDNPNFPNLSSAYSSLLTALETSKRKEAFALADEVLAKYPDPNASIRDTAYTVKFRVLGAKKPEEASKLGAKILATETNPSLLRSAAQFDRENSLKLLEKAMQERAKNSSPTATPKPSDLRWDYALSLGRAGRKDEALKIALEGADEAKKNIVELEALPKDDPKRRTLDIALGKMRSRYMQVATFYTDLKEYQNALDYLDLVEQSAGDDALEGRSYLCACRADIYLKMGKPQLALESYAQSFASFIDRQMRDKIVDLAKKNGKKPEDIFAHARQIRSQNAVPIKEFELKTVEGPVASLSSIKSKVALVNFFYPT